MQEGKRERVCANELLWSCSLVRYLTGGLAFNFYRSFVRWRFFFSSIFPFVILILYISFQIYVSLPLPLAPTLIAAHRPSRLRTYLKNKNQTQKICANVHGSNRNWICCVLIRCPSFAHMHSIVRPSFTALVCCVCAARTLRTYRHCRTLSSVRIPYAVLLAVHAVLLLLAATAIVCLGRAAVRWLRRSPTAISLQRKRTAYTEFESYNRLNDWFNRIANICNILKWTVVERVHEIISFVLQFVRFNSQKHSK